MNAPRRILAVKNKHLGDIILRVETAAMYGLSVLSHTARGAAGAEAARST